jgi:hypothetical protein
MPGADPATERTDMADLSVCAGCGRPSTATRTGTLATSRARAVQALCPDCQTPDDTAEAEEHARTVDYAALKQYGSARLVTTLELQAANATAVEQDWIAFTDEAMEMLREYDHLLVLGGTAGDLGIAACACSVALTRRRRLMGGSSSSEFAAIAMLPSA